MPDTKPGVKLDENGVCVACNNMENRKSIDWEQRKKTLIEMCENIKKENKELYDCVVAVSGGKDSIFQVWYMKEICKMKVLAVCVMPHLRTREGIENFNNMMSELGVDTISITLKPKTFKSVRRKAFKEIGEPNWTDHCTVFAGVARIAYAYKVPLTVWGEDIAVEFGGRTSNKRVSSADGLRDNDLVKGMGVDRWYDDENVQKKFTFFYHFPPFDELKKHKLKSIYLGYYVEWDGYTNYLKAKDVAGFQPRRAGPLSGNYLDYDNMDEKLCEINIWLKYIKFGFWRPTDQCCYHIWNGRLDRKDAVKIVNQLQDEFPIEYFQDFLDFHSITQEEFWEVVEKFRNKEIWTEFKGEWKLKHPLE
ncbi:MAG: N-acetyl sugar amidotransferase [Bacteroidetes bacterium]|nr:N-acetyl sugar amidotransferase [Bacteroidota bacterium]